MILKSDFWERKLGACQEGENIATKSPVPKHLKL